MASPVAEAVVELVLVDTGFQSQVKKALSGAENEAKSTANAIDKGLTKGFERASDAAKNFGQDLKKSLKGDYTKALEKAIGTDLTTAIKKAGKSLDQFESEAKAAFESIGFKAEDLESQFREIDSVSLDRIRQEFIQIGNESDETRLDAERLTSSLKEVGGGVSTGSTVNAINDITQAANRADAAVDSISKSGRLDSLGVDFKRASVAGNLFGNIAQEIAAALGVGGPFQLAIGQLTEYGTESLFEGLGRSSDEAADAARLAAVALTTETVALEAQAGQAGLTSIAEKLEASATADVGKESVKTTRLLGLETSALLAQADAAGVAAAAQSALARGDGTNRPRPRLSKDNPILDVGGIQKGLLNNAAESVDEVGEAAVASSSKVGFLTNALGLLGKGSAASTASLSAFLIPVAAVAAAIVVVTAALAASDKGFAPLINAAKELGDTFVSSVKPAVDGLVGALKPIGNIVNDLIPLFTVLLRTTFVPLKVAMEGLGAILDVLAAGFRLLRTAIIETINFVIPAINFLIEAYNKIPLVDDLPKIEELTDANFKLAGSYQETAEGVAAYNAGLEKSKQDEHNKLVHESYDSYKLLEGAIKSGTFVRQNAEIDKNKRAYEELNKEIRKGVIPTQQDLQDVADAAGISLTELTNILNANQVAFETLQQARIEAVNSLDTMTIASTQLGAAIGDVDLSRLGDPADITAIENAAQAIITASQQVTAQAASQFGTSFTEQFINGFEDDKITDGIQAALKRAFDGVELSQDYVDMTNLFTLDGYDQIAAQGAMILAEQGLAASTAYWDEIATFTPEQKQRLNDNLGALTLISQQQRDEWAQIGEVLATQISAGLTDVFNKLLVALGLPMIPIEVGLVGVNGKPLADGGFQSDIDAFTADAIAANPIQIRVTPKLELTDLPGVSSLGDIPTPEALRIPVVPDIDPVLFQSGFDALFGDESVSVAVDGQYDGLVDGVADLDLEKDVMVGADVDGVNRTVDALDLKTTITTDADITPARSKVNSLKGEGILVKVDADTSAAAEALRRLAAQARTIRIPVGAARAGAAGMIIQGAVQSFAAGGIPNASQVSSHVARATNGGLLMYAEDGVDEAFIRMDKTKYLGRSLSILEQVAKFYGRTTRPVQTFASGGIIDNSSSTATTVRAGNVNNVTFNVTAPGPISAARAMERKLARALS